MESQNVAINESSKSLIENIKDMIENYNFLGNIETNKENVVISKEMISKEENNDKFIENHIYLISPN